MSAAALFSDITEDILFRNDRYMLEKHIQRVLDSVKQDLPDIQFLYTYDNKHLLTIYTNYNFKIVIDVSDVYYSDKSKETGKICLDVCHDADYYNDMSVFTIVPLVHRHKTHKNFFTDDPLIYIGSVVNLCANTIWPEKKYNYIDPYDSIKLYVSADGEVCKYADHSPYSLGAECIFTKGTWPCVYIAFLKQSSDDEVNIYFNMHNMAAPAPAPAPAAADDDVSAMTDPTFDLEKWNSVPYLLRTYEFSLKTPNVLGFGMLGAITLPLWTMLGAGAYYVYRQMR